MRWNTQGFIKFCKDRSGYIGLSFLVGAVCLWSVACGKQGTELELYDAGRGTTAVMAERAGEDQGSDSVLGNGSGSVRSILQQEESASGTASSRQYETEKAESQQKKVSGNTARTNREEPGAAADSGAAVSAEEEKILVFVCGAVKKEGVYSLRTDARVYEAVEAAGGFAEDADRDAVNLAMPMHDGEQLRIPTEEEMEALSSEAERAQPGVTGGGSSKTEDDAGGISDSVRKVNLNTASREELMTVPGIGGVRADAILEYRESSGGFRNIEEIKNVSGIKAGIYAKIQDYITAE